MLLVWAMISMRKMVYLISIHKKSDMLGGDYIRVFCDFFQIYLLLRLKGFIAMPGLLKTPFNTTQAVSVRRFDGNL